MDKVRDEIVKEALLTDGEIEEVHKRADEAFRTYLRRTSQKKYRTFTGLLLEAQIEKLLKLDRIAVLSENQNTPLVPNNIDMLNSPYNFNRHMFI